MSGAARLDPWTTIVGGSWSSGVAVLVEMRGFALTAGIDGGAQVGFPFALRDDVVASGLVGVPRQVSAGEVLDSRNSVYIGRGLVNPGGVQFTHSSLGFQVIPTSTTDEPPDELFFDQVVFLDGRLQTGYERLATFQANAQGQILRLKYSFANGHRWVLQFIDALLTEPDYQDLFLYCVPVGMGKDTKGIVRFTGNPQEPISTSAKLTAYPLGSYFVARADGGCDVFSDLAMKVPAVSRWSAASSFSAYGQQITFDRKGTT